MKILVLAPHPFFKDQPSSIALKMMLETLVSGGHAVTAMVYGGGEDVTIKGCRILRVKKPVLLPQPGPDLSWKNAICDAIMLRMATRLLKTEKFNLIHAEGKAVLMARYFQRRFNVPYVYEMNISPAQDIDDKQKAKSSLVTRFMKSSVKKSCGVIANCIYLEQLARTYNPSLTIQRLEHLVLPEPEPEEEKPRKVKLRLTRKHTHLLYLGSLEPQQGLELLLKAFSLAYLDKEKVDLTIIGCSKTTIATLKRQAKSLGIGSGVRFYGPKPTQDQQLCYDQADILIAPKTTGHAIPEELYAYLGSGKPILAIRSDANSQVLDDTTAYLVDPFQSDISFAMMRLVQDQELRNQFVENAQQLQADQFTRENYRLKLNSFYKRIERELIS